MEGAAFDDSGEQVPAQDFDWASVEKSFGEDLLEFARELEAGQYTAEEIDRAYKGISALLKWVWQGGMKDPRGMQIRSAIVCWVVIRGLHPLTLTELAEGFGKDKQSFGRWVDNFKEFFPAIRSPHFR